MRRTTFQSRTSSNDPEAPAERAHDRRNSFGGACTGQLTAQTVNGIAVIVGRGSRPLTDENEVCFKRAARYARNRGRP